MRNGEIGNAIELFDEMLDRDATPWTTQMRAFHLAWLSLFTGSGVSQLLLPHIYTWKMNLWQMSSSIAWLLSFLVPGIFQGEMARGRRRDGEMERQQRRERVRRRQQNFLRKLCLFEPKKTIRAYKSFGENVRGKNEPFPLKVCINIFVCLFIYFEFWLLYGYSIFKVF